MRLRLHLREKIAKMYFKRLEIHGFKSFAEPVTIEFNKGITCIVGPNGSGKSNISDAIRWVLGEQSPKTLRGGKMDEVIFSGTEHKNPRGMAEVTLVIDNSEKILNLEYAEVAITRKMFRSGESEYYINNNRCRLKDIRELIMDTGIGVEGYSIIGQGKIADIISGKPEDRRTIFEEAGGIVSYKSKKAEAEKKLESTGQSMERLGDIIAELTDRISGLKEERDKAQEYLILSEELKKLDINIVLKNIDKNKKVLQTYSDDLEKLRSTIDLLTNEKNSAQLQEERLDEEKNLLEKDISDLGDDIIRLMEDINSMEVKQRSGRERLIGIGNESERLESDILNLENKRNEENNNIDLLERDVASISSESLKLADKLNEKSQEMDLISQETARLSEGIDFAEKRISELQKKHIDRINEKNSIENSKQSLIRRKTDLFQTCQDAKIKISDFGKSAINSERIISLEEEKLQKSLLEIDSISKKEEGLRKELIDIRAKKTSMTLESSKLSSRVKTFEEMESNYEGYSLTVRKMMKASINGIIDVVSNLMNVPKGFEVAIETALGGHMQNIVCKDNRAAETGIKFLKANEAGRLTFLPVESIRSRNKNRKISDLGDEKGVIDFAMNIIDFDEKYRNVYEYLLGNVLVAEDMHTALALSGKLSGLKIVTLDGEFVNTSGAITGGKHKNKSANILGRKSEIQQLSDKINEIERELIKVNQEEKKCNQDLDSAKRMLEEAETAKWDLKERLTKLTTEHKNISEKLHENEISLQHAESELSDVETKLLEADDNIKNMAGETIDSENEIGMIERDSEETREKLKKVKQKGEVLSEEITKLKISINTYNAKAEATDAMLKRARKAKEEFESEIQSKENSIQLLQNEKERLTVDTESYEKELEIKRNQREDIGMEIEQKTAGKQVLAEKKKVQQDEEKRRNVEIQSLTDQRNDLDIKKAKAETYGDALINKVWDEHGMSLAQAEELREENFALSRGVRESSQIKGKLADIGEVNIGAIKEFETVSERLDFMNEQMNDIVSGRQELTDLIEDLDKSMKRKFKENYERVLANFEMVFSELFGGGKVELVLSDENNPLESGIEIVAQPPGKKLQNIDLLSGGEKTMTAIALMFAILKTRPTPFCILDEVEAALDDENIERFATYLRNFKDIQFALITHQKETMEYADSLYGITMAEQGVSQVLSLKVEKES